jgi:hypothetical protein
MTIKASGRSALILATGLFVCFAGPSQAEPEADNAADNAAVSSKPETAAGTPLALNRYARRGARHSKRYAHRKSSKVALKSSTAKKADAPDVADNDGDGSTAIPPSVANANAQLASADTPTGNAKAMSARANEILQTTPDRAANAQPAADAEVVSPDQLNDVDRALHETARPAPTLAMAAAEAPAAPAAPVTAASSSESSAWDQTSLIGKIFIGFGALLTMASAARMFMA